MLKPALRRFVGAARRVDALFGQPQARDRDPVDDVRLDDLYHVGRFHSAVPDAIGVNHDGRPVLALIQTAGAVGSHLPFQASRRQFLFEEQLQLTQPFRVATAAGVFGRALIDADKDVMFEPCHN